MKVKVFGFVWEAKGVISIDDFFTRIKAGVEDEVKVLSSQTIPYPDEGLRLLAVAKIGTIWGGVIAHFKSRTRFIESEIGEGKIEFSDQKIGVKRKHSEFNFFILNPSNGAGLYQHYHSATHLSTFCGFCAGKYFDMHTAQKQQGKLLHYPYLNKSDYASRINELSQINNIEIEYLGLDGKKKLFAPVSQYMRRLKFKVFYRINLSGDGVRSAFIESIRSLKDEAKYLNVSGLDLNGENVTHRLIAPSVFQEFDHRELHVNFTLDINNMDETIGQSRNVQSLIKLATSGNEEAIKFFNHSVKEVK